MVDWTSCGWISVLVGVSASGGIAGCGAAVSDDVGCGAPVSDDVGCGAAVSDDVGCGAAVSDEVGCGACDASSAVVVDAAGAGVELVAEALLTAGVPDPASGAAGVGPDAAVPSATGRASAAGTAAFGPAGGFTWAGVSAAAGVAVATTSVPINQHADNHEAPWKSRPDRTGRLGGPVAVK
ncbi:MAG: hypothetical protein ACJ72N_07795 [Labedaea sp.]